MFPEPEHKKQTAISKIVDETRFGVGILESNPVES